MWKGVFCLHFLQSSVCLCGRQIVRSLRIRTNLPFRGLMKDGYWWCILSKLFPLTAESEQVRNSSVKWPLVSGHQAIPAFPATKLPIRYSFSRVKLAPPQIDCLIPPFVSFTNLTLPVHMLFMGTQILFKNGNPVHNGVCPASRSHKMRNTCIAVNSQLASVCATQQKMKSRLNVISSTVQVGACSKSPICLSQGQASKIKWSQKPMNQESLMKCSHKVHFNCPH